MGINNLDQNEYEECFFNLLQTQIEKTREKFLMLTRNFIDFNISLVISSTYFNGTKLKKLFTSRKVKREIKKIMKNSIRNPEYLAMIWKSSIFYQTLSHRIMWSRIFDIKTYLFKQMLFDFSFYSESILVQSVRTRTGGRYCACFLDIYYTTVLFIIHITQKAIVL